MIALRDQFLSFPNGPDDGPDMVEGGVYLLNKKNKKHGGQRSSAPESSGGQPRVMDKSAFELSKFLLYIKVLKNNDQLLCIPNLKSHSHASTVVKFTLMLNEFYYHYN
jgi:hypothetical protein